MLLGDRFLSSYIDEFYKIYNTQIDASNVILKFATFLFEKYPKLYNTDFQKCSLMSIGYYKDSLLLSSSNIKDGNGKSTTGIGAVASSDTLSNFGGLNKKYSFEYCKNHTCFKMARLIEKEINNYAIKYNKQNKIGGGIALLKISNKGDLVWLKNEPKQTAWNTLKDFSDDYRNNKIKIHFTSEEGKRLIENMLLN